VTGRRSRPYKRGGTTRASVSSMDEDEETQFTPIIPSSRKPGFTAVNTPRTWADDHGLEAENRAISSFPAGAGPASTKKPIPPAKRVDQVALFTPKDLRGIYGGGNPGLICATVKAEDIARAVIRTRNYICLSPDAHFKPPGTICDNAEMLDIYGQDDPIDRRVATVPVLRKVDKLWMYCGNYKVGDRRMVTLAEWHEGGENVKKHWAKKVQDTEWGREWLVRKGWLVHGEIRNVSLDEILGYFRIVGYFPPWHAQQITNIYDKTSPTTRKASASRPPRSTSMNTTMSPTTRWSTSVLGTTPTIIPTPGSPPSSPTTSSSPPPPKLRTRGT
jgi:hypothetical protein